MMISVLLMIAVPTCVAAAWFFRNPYYRQSVRTLRDELFAVRGRLFDFCSECPDLDYGDVAYGMLRGSLNGLIRIAPDIRRDTLFTWSRVEHQKGLAPWRDRWEAYLAECETEVADQLRDHLDMAIHAIASHVARTSGMLLVFNAAAWASRATSRWSSRLGGLLAKPKAWVRRRLDRLAEQSAAMPGVGEAFEAANA